MKSPSVLIAICSCNADRHTHQAIRDTWLKGQGIPHVFFAGVGFKDPKDDELVMNAPDDYNHLYEKCRELFKHGLLLGFDFIFLCYRDTYCNLSRLLDGQLLAHDYAGHRTCGGEQAHLVPIEFDGKGLAEYASGGAGIWLSAKAMHAILQSNFTAFPHWADDLGYGTILAYAGIPLFHDPRFQKHGRHLFQGSATTHLSQGTGNYSEEWMYACHRNSFL